MRKDLLVICILGLIALACVVGGAIADKGGITPWQTMIEERLDNIYEDIRDKLVEEFPLLVDEPEEPKQEFHVEELEPNKPIILEQSNPFWQEVSKATITPPRGTDDLFLGVKLNATASVNQTCQNCELLIRTRIDLEDGRRFYTMWIRFNETKPTTIVTQERISNIIHDGRWATGNHDLGLIVNQEYYNLTLEAGAFLAKATIHNSTIEVFYLSETSGLI